MKNEIDTAEQKKSGLKDKLGEAIEQVGKKIEQAGAEKLGKKIHDAGDALESSYSDQSHPNGKDL